MWRPNGTAQSITGTATQNLRFPGQYFMVEQGLNYNWHRYYDPTTGRYTQPDPLRFIDGPAIYAYAGNNPVMNVDPWGLATTIVIWGESGSSNSSDSSGWGNGHSGIYVKGKNGNMIYDPSGSYTYNGNDVLGTGRLGSGTPDEIGSSTDYLQSGPYTTYTFNTTPEQEEEIFNNADRLGGGGIAQCASLVTAALSGVGPFTSEGAPTPGWHNRIYPSDLGDYLKKLPGVIIDDPGFVKGSISKE